MRADCITFPLLVYRTLPFICLYKPWAYIIHLRKFRKGILGGSVNGGACARQRLCMQLLVFELVFFFCSFNLEQVLPFSAVFKQSITYQAR